MISTDYADLSPAHGTLCELYLLNAKRRGYLLQEPGFGRNCWNCLCNTPWLRSMSWGPAIAEIEPTFERTAEPVTAEILSDAHEVGPHARSPVTA